jgi:hypothetical protein
MESKLSPETRRHWEHFKEETRTRQMIIQGHMEGREMSVPEEEYYVKDWMRYQLLEDAKID